MEKPYITKKGSIHFDDKEGVGIILSYNVSLENKPSTMFIYWGNDKYKEAIWNFRAEKFGKDKIEKYWKEVLELENNKKLTLDTLCDTIENTFIPEGVLKEFREKRKE